MLSVAKLSSGSCHRADMLAHHSGIPRPAPLPLSRSLHTTNDLAEKKGQKRKEKIGSKLTHSPNRPRIPTSTSAC